MTRTIDHREGTMQYGAAGTRNLATDLTESGYDDRDYTQTTADRLKIQPTNPHVEMIEERPRNNENNRTHLEETLEGLHNEIKTQEKLTTEGPPIQPIGGEPGGGKIRREKISRQASDNLILQTQTVRELCYDTTRVMNVLRTMQSIDQEGSWYHTIAGKARAILRFRQAEAKILIEQGTDAAEGIARMRNGEWKGIDETWEDLKIHPWKAKEALKAANRLLQQ